MFPLDELKLQPNGGRGLTLMDVDAKDPLVSVATFGERLRVHGQWRAAASRRKKMLSGGRLADYAGKRARKGAR